MSLFYEEDFGAINYEEGKNFIKKEGFEIIVVIENCERGDTYKIEHDKVELFCLRDFGEPEDKTLYREFSDLFDIPTLMKLAYFAGKNNIKFDVTYIKKEIEDNKVIKEEKHY